MYAKYNELQLPFPTPSPSTHLATSSSSNCSSFSITLLVLIWLVFLPGLQLRFVIFLVSERVCCNFKIWILSVLRLDKRDKAYKAQAHCLTYTLIELHEMFPPSTVTLSPVGPIAVKMKENSCLSITTDRQTTILLQVCLYIGR